MRHVELSTAQIRTLKQRLRSDVVRWAQHGQRQGGNLVNRL
jgi:hypothetical protein